MPWWIIALGALPALISLAEGLFGAGKGEEKHGAVTGLVNAVLGILGAVSTGPQAALWKTLTPLVGPIVEALARVLFPKGTTVTPAESVVMATRFLKGDFSVLEDKVSLIDLTTQPTR